MDWDAPYGVARQFGTNSALGVLNAVAQVDPSERDPYLAYCSTQGTGPLPDVARFRDAWEGDWDEWEGFAWQAAEDAGYLSGPTGPAYFDVGKFAGDLSHDYTVVDTGRGSVYVFRDM